MAKAWEEKVSDGVFPFKDGDLVRTFYDNKFYYGIVGSINNKLYIFWNDGGCTCFSDCLIMDDIIRCTGEVIFKNED